jgi:hypothetical protein
MVMHACTFSYSGSIGRRIIVQGQTWEKTQDPIQKIAKTKNGTTGMIQVVEHLPSKFKDLSSNPSTAKKKSITLTDRLQNRD